MRIRYLLCTFYPSSKKDNFSDSTDEEGYINFHFHIKEDSLTIEREQKQNIENDARINVKVSKGDRRLLELTRTFKITEK